MTVNAGPHLNDYAAYPHLPKYSPSVLKKSVNCLQTTDHSLDKISQLVFQLLLVLNDLRPLSAHLIEMQEAPNILIPLLTPICRVRPFSLMTVSTLFLPMATYLCQDGYFKPWALQLGLLCFRRLQQPGPFHFTHVILLIIKNRSTLRKCYVDFVYVTCPVQLAQLILEQACVKNLKFCIRCEISQHS